MTVLYRKRASREESRGGAVSWRAFDATTSQAVLTYCALVGAIGMARALWDEQLSREILKTVAQRLKNPTS